MIATALPLIASGSLKPRTQDHAKASLAPLLKKEDGLIDWTLPRRELHNRVRGFTPWPGAFTFLDKGLVKILKTEIAPGNGRAGDDYRGRREPVACGTGESLLRIVTIQPAGKKPMDASEFLRGHRGIEGKKFDKL